MQWKKSELKELTHDFRKFLQYLKIIDKKTSKIVPFVLNKHQEKVLREIERQRALGIPVRIIILKDRQKGISTLIEAFIYWITSYRNSRKAAVVAHEGVATNNFWEMTNRYYDNLPKILQPTKEYHNAKRLSYKKSTSEIAFYTAEGGDVGSGNTHRYVHISELSKWRDPKTSLTSLLQTVPFQPDTIVIIESTAKGFGNEYHNRWLKAKEKDDVFVPIFLSWLDDDEYTLAFQNEIEKQDLIKSIDAIEEDLLRKGATYEHLNWRRKVGLPQCNNDPNEFKEEYPSDDIEPFVTSGRPVFDMRICQNNYLEAKPPIKIGNLEYIYALHFNQLNDSLKELAIHYHKGEAQYCFFNPANLEKKFKDREPIGVQFVEDTKGYIKIHIPIDIKENEMYRYAAGTDVAEGLEQGDYSVVKVKDRKHKKIALTWRGHIDPDLLSEEIHKIELFLRRKWFVNIEKNNHGLTTITGCFKLGVKQFYQHDFRTGIEVEKDELGTFTSGGASGTRNYMLNLLKEEIREDVYKDDDIEFWNETRTFVRNSKGKEQAQGKDKDPATKCFDDMVMASALMLMCDRWMPNYFETKAKEPDADKPARPFVRQKKGAGDYTF